MMSNQAFNFFFRENFSKIQETEKQLDESQHPERLTEEYKND
jgi:hypothetical protein